MASQLNFEVEAPPDTPRRDVSRARRATGALQELWDRLSRKEWQALFEEVDRTLHEPVGDSTPGEMHPLTKKPVPTAEERAKVRFLSLLDGFTSRRQLLDDSLTAPQVAKLLGSSRQTPLSRLEADNLLAVFDRGAWRFPAWQFDPEGPDGVIQGLPKVLGALNGLSPFAKLVWLTRPSPYLDRRSPAETLREGELDRVLDEARSLAAA